MSLAEKFYVWTSSDLKPENLSIRGEQLRHRLDQYPLMIGAQLLIAMLLCSLMWEAVAHHVLLGWFSVLFIGHLVEAYHWWRYRDRLDTLEECKRWRTRFILFVSMIGTIWGAAGVLMFVPGDLAYQTMLICVILGAAAGAVTINPVFPPALYIYVGMLIAPVMFANLFVGDKTHYILALMLLIYLVFVLNAGRGLSRTFEQSLRGEWENARLVGQLVKEKLRAEQAQHAAESASRAKSKFFAAANHDLRQPMHALTMYVEVLKNSPLNPQAKMTVERLERSLDVMNGMFDTLLDISRLDAGVVQVRPESFALAPLLDSLREEFSMLAHDKGLSIKVADCTETVYSDPRLLGRILRNLLSNAVRYTERGQVELGCRMTEDGLQIDVSDSGIGIASEHLPHIFEEYYQVNNQQRDRSKGLGLGLAIVERLAKLLDCKLQVRSAPGEGACFSIVLPVGGPDVMIPDDLAT